MLFSRKEGENLSGERKQSASEVLFHFLCVRTPKRTGKLYWERESWARREFYLIFLASALPKVERRHSFGRATRLSFLASALPKAVRRLSFGRATQFYALSNAKGKASLESTVSKKERSQVALSRWAHEKYKVTRKRFAMLARVGERLL